MGIFWIRLEKGMGMASGDGRRLVRRCGGKGDATGSGGDAVPATAMAMRCHEEKDGYWLVKASRDGNCHDTRTGRIGDEYSQCGGFRKITAELIKKGRRVHYREFQMVY